MQGLLRATRAGIIATVAGALIGGGATIEAAQAGSTVRAAGANANANPAAGANAAAGARAAPQTSTAVPPPDQDPFYRPPPGYQSAAPGTVLGDRPASAALYGAFALHVNAWQILYRTADTQGAAEAATALIVEPTGAAPAGGRPLVSYQVAEDSLGTQCAPSYQLQAACRATTRWPRPRSC